MEDWKSILPCYGSLEITAMNVTAVTAKNVPAMGVTATNVTAINVIAMDVIDFLFLRDASHDIFVFTSSIFTF